MTDKKNSHDNQKDSLSDSGEIFENVFREAIAEEKRKGEENKLKKSGEGVKGESIKPAPESKQAKKPKVKKETRRKEKKQPSTKKKPGSKTASRAALLFVLLVVLAAAYTFYFKGEKFPNLVIPKQKSVPTKSRVTKPGKASGGVAVKRPPSSRGESHTLPPPKLAKKPSPPPPRQVKEVKSSQVTRQKKTLPLPTPQTGELAKSSHPKVTLAKQEPPKSPPVREANALLYPYSIYLGAFKTLARAKRAVALYQKRGLNPYWVKVDLGQKGTWYRVFEGHFPSKEKAEAFIQKRQLRDAEVKATKYTNLIGIYSDKEELKRLSLELLRLGYCPYAIPAQDGRVKLFTGAFYTQEGAKSLVAELGSKGIKTTVVMR
ncbi:MAG: SPOR domain-containing protein [Deltaproteobacteria bacterium]|nr:SPOR domain-containing protein [Deltaproteobacteria bacterium]MBW1979080.1 SPOR domain-containing protein [Deltaproteobacteria bacterium]MBW2043765.1 SPOR domain-containing protein [Deltaproteobacteria bacterium]MBW2299929.1 SPOR domain-containing protein [Deltaproteobacteria bacterium]